MFEQIYRCRDGHLFVVRSYLKVHLMSARFGTSKFLRCPVDHRWRMADLISPNDLSEEQLVEAKAHVF